MTRKQASLLLLTLLILSLHATTIKITANPSTKVSIYPTNITGPPPSLNKNFTIFIKIQNVTDLYTYGIALSWNPAVLNCLSWTYNKTFFSPDIMMPGVIDNVAGIMDPPFGATFTDPPHSKGVNGSGTLADVKFKVVGYGKSWINFTQCDVMDYMGYGISRDLINGTFFLPPPHGPTAKKTHTPLEPRVNQTVTFDASASSPGFNGTHYIAIDNYKWNFGDGNITTIKTLTIKHKYTAAGTYTVNLTVTCKYDPVLAGLGQLSNSTWQQITIHPPPPHGPTAIKTHTPSLYPRVNQTVTFNASASSPGWNGTHDVAIANYTWNFGDGNITTVIDPIINHTYTEANVYTVNLTVKCEFDPVLAGLGLLSNSTRQQITIYMLRYWYWKPNYTDYAPSGVPDFDQRQDEWRNPYPPVGTWSWCGPTAVANSLWWLDSRYEVKNVPPPAVSDSFPLVQAYGSWDDHNPRNVRPLINNLAWYMDTDGVRTGLHHCGTEVHDMESGINWYITNKGLDTLLYVDTLKAPSFLEVQYEVERSEDVILLLGFWQWNGTNWVRVAGHYVTVAGLNPGDMQIAICDPILDTAELGGAGRVFPKPHLPGHTFVTHNNASYASQDIYNVGPSTSPGGAWELIDYPAYMIIYNIGENLPNDLKPYAGKFDYTLPIFTEVEYAVFVSPKGPIFHDVAITDLDLTKNVLGIGLYMNIYVFTQNQGNFTEDFTVTLLYDSNTIGTRVVRLYPRGSTNLTFTWHAEGVPKNLKGYTITAQASLVPGEIDPADNTYIDGKVYVSVPCDVTGYPIPSPPDGKVWVEDLWMFSKAWGSQIGDPRYNPLVDFTGIIYGIPSLPNGWVGVEDLFLLGKNWGKRDP